MKVRSFMSVSMTFSGIRTTLVRTICWQYFRDCKYLPKLTLRKRCLYSELFWSAFSRICTEYEAILRISPYSVQIRENTDENNSEYKHFSRKVQHWQNIHLGFTTIKAEQSQYITNQWNICVPEKNLCLLSITIYVLMIYR